MANLKCVILKGKQKADKTYNIKLRVTHAGGVKYIPTPWNLKESEITPKGEIKSRYYKEKCDDLLRQHQAVLDFLGARVNHMTIEQLVEYLDAKQEQSKPFSLDFVKYTLDYVVRLIKQGKEGTARNYSCAINSLMAYAHRDSIDISQITTKFLQGWVDTLSGNRAPSLYCQALRAMHNRAKKEFNDEDMNYIPIPGSPFLRLEIPKPGPTRKRALTVEEIWKIINYKPLEKPRGFDPFGHAGLTLLGKIN